MRPAGSFTWVLQHPSESASPEKAPLLAASVWHSPSAVLLAVWLGPALARRILSSRLMELGNVVGGAAKTRRMICGIRRTQRDAALLLKPLLEERLPPTWIPYGEERDVRQLLTHRDKLVRLPAHVKNKLQHQPMNRWFTKKGKLWSKFGEKRLRVRPMRLLCKIPTKDQPSYPVSCISCSNP
jgi:hypothetical protein